MDARLGVLSGGSSGEEGSWVEFLCEGGVTVRMQIEVDILLGAERNVIDAQYALNSVMDRRGISRNPGCLYRTKPMVRSGETWPCRTYSNVSGRIHLSDRQVLFAHLGDVFCICAVLQLW